MLRPADSMNKHGLHIIVRRLPDLYTRHQTSRSTQCGPRPRPHSGDRDTIKVRDSSRQYKTSENAYWTKIPKQFFSTYFLCLNYQKPISRPSLETIQV